MHGGYTSMKVYDTFIFHNEVELARLRIDLLKDYVDCFIVVEANQDHRGKPRKRMFPLYELGQIAEIEYIVVDLPDYGSDDLAASRRENYQRDCILYGLDNVSPDDLILFGDADEIVDPRAFSYIKEMLSIKNKPIKLGQYLSYYAPNMRTDEWWYGTTAAQRKHFTTLVELRNRTTQDTRFINGAGWHMSYCGNLEFIREKLQAFCHADLVAAFNTDDNIQHALETGANLFGRNEHFTKVKIDNTFPSNIGKFKHLLV